jgi:hypothetical protein
MADAIRGQLPHSIEDKRATLIALLALLDAEAFSWLLLALGASAQLRGANTQVWPDGLGGFRDRERIEAIRAEAAKLLSG